MGKRMGDSPQFHKYDGLGNDYIVIDPAEFGFEPAAEAVRAVCDRHRGVGADGILLGPIVDGTPSRNPTSSWKLRIFNPDGSEAAKSGNGLRIFSWYLYERGLVGREAFEVVTKGGRAGATILDPGRRLVQVDMGRPNFQAAALPALAEEPELVDSTREFGGHRCRISCVSMGNPHCVVLGLGSGEDAARTVGPLIENSPLFPDRVNVQFLEPLGPKEIRISIWERGAGYTLASGSSSCAAAAVARRLGLAGDEVTVSMPGGNLEVRFVDGCALLTGPVEKCFDGRFAEELLERIGPAGWAREARS